MKVKIIKFIQCGPCSINGPKFQEISIFETFYIVIRHLFFVTFIHFMYINTKMFVIRILGQKKCLDIPYESLNLFFFVNKVLDFFHDFIIIVKFVQIDMLCIK
jgi:hypothetical protein